MCGSKVQVRIVVTALIAAVGLWASRSQADDDAKPAAAPKSAPKVAASDDALAKNASEYYRRKANVPPNVQISVSGIEASKIKGAKTGTLEAGGQKVQFTASEDGRYVIFGDLEDLTVDPFAAVMKKIDLKGRAFKGPKDAKVTIVEYSDYQCPYCSRGYNTIEKEVLKEYGDKVKFYYKNLPLSFHPYAEPAAIAAECASMQKEAAFWKVYSFFFENQKDMNPQNVKEKALEQLKGTGVDEAKFNDCFDNKKSLERIKADSAEAQALGISGTPGFIINGRALKGAYPFPQFKTIIDDELAHK
ncbi:MAG: DsbA family protein [Deltaproteobacteria bacterium]|nr:DsbA family protein [Deltaproteobacteria bacterium]